MKVNVLIAGAGQLGSRYLQGLSIIRFDLNIWVFDISTYSLVRAKKRWNECKSNSHRVQYINSIELLPKNFDMVFVTTTADVRLQIVKEINDRCYVNFWILEKVLSQSVEDLEAIGQTIKKNAWVNTPMYHWPLYHELYSLGKFEGPIEASFRGFNGLACNAIHYIDFVSRWNDSYIIEIDVKNLSPNWIPSKREGFMEIEGSINFLFSDKSKLCLNGNESKSDYKISIKTSREIWTVNEESGMCLSSLGKKFKSSILLQSELISLLLEEILKYGVCKLPKLEQSIDQHKVLLKVLIEHWNNNMPNKIKKLPIT